VLGDMAELGDEAEKSHREIGELLQELNLSVDYYIGEYGRLIGAKIVALSVEEIAIELQKLIEENVDSIIYCKSSNSKGLHRLPAMLTTTRQS
jgi:UDP-N-acetylmuramyl pentapeptide synthase